MGELNSAAELVRNEEKAAFLEAIKDGEELLFPYRNFCYPKYTYLHLPDRKRSVYLLDALEYLDISQEEVLPRIFQMKDGTESEFTGLFTDDGMQNLANYIGTKITYVHQPTSEFILDLSTLETYSPVEKTEE